MSRSQFALSVASLIIAASCAAPDKTPEAAAAVPAAVDTAALKLAIQAREKEWSAAFLAGNAAGVAALYTEDGASVPATGDLDRGRAGIAKSIAKELDSLNVTGREDITEEVTPVGNYAIEIGHYTYTGMDKVSKAPASGSGRYMVIWRKDADGVWRLHRDIGNNAPATPTKNS